MELIHAFGGFLLIMFGLISLNLIKDREFGENLGAICAFCIGGSISHTDLTTKENI